MGRHCRTIVASGVLGAAIGVLSAGCGASSGVGAPEDPDSSAGAPGADASRAAVIDLERAVAGGPGGGWTQGADGTTDEAPAVSALEDRLSAPQIWGPVLGKLLAPESASAAPFLDVNQDGAISDDDLRFWGAEAVPERHEGLVVVSFVYDEWLDVNQDGAVDTFDFVTLKLGVARELALAGAALEWNGTLVDPEQVIVASDGATVVTSTERRYRELLDLRDGTNTNKKLPFEKALPTTDDTQVEEGGEDPCKVTASSDSPDTDPMEFHWVEHHPMWCLVIPSGTRPYECTLKISIEYHSYRSYYLTCGETENDVTYSLTYTTGSTISTEVGASIDQHVSLGVTWGNSSEVTETEEVISTITNPRGKESRYWFRYQSYRVEYTRKAIPDPELDAMCDQPYNESASDTLKTTSKETESKSKGCGCPQVLEE